MEEVDSKTSFYVGHKARETVCLDYSGQSCAVQFEWLNSYYGYDDEGTGILGLKPDPYYYGTPPLLMSYLYNQGVID